jgi:NTE family protein
MPDTSIAVPMAAAHHVLKARPERITLVLQGGGALGAYQAGVYEALEEAGMRPDWVIGTSIGAINASLIAGNAPGERVAAMKAFWDRVQHGGLQRLLTSLPYIGPQLATSMTMAAGLEAFFKPNPLAFLGPHWKLGSEQAGYYSTAPLRETLSKLVDFDRIAAGECRLTVGAANVRTAEMRYFDSRDTRLDVRHVMASGALPPAFPAVRIDDDLYWDGGILSNTPVEAVFDDYPRRSGLVFAVHIWNPHGHEPDTIMEVLNRQKDVQYSSRAHTHIMRQKQLHQLRHIVAELSKRLPPAERAKPEVEEMAGYGCLTTMHVVRLLAPVLADENHTKDIDFSAAGIQARWQSGLRDTRAVLARAPWQQEVDPLEGFVLHEASEGGLIETT